jgi:hypothetical protein
VEISDLCGDHADLGFSADSPLILLLGCVLGFCRVFAESPARVVCLGFAESSHDATEISFLRSSREWQPSTTSYFEFVLPLAGATTLSLCRISMSVTPQNSHKVPGFSVVGLLILFASGGWAIWTMKSSIGANPEFGGFAGFAVLMILMITIPVSFILGLIGMRRNEEPRFLPWSLVILSALPILVILLELIITSRS